MIAKPQTDSAEDFSLILGGPLYQLLLRSGFIRPPFGKLGARIGVITALAWLPLVPLTMLSGRFASGVHVPFLYDFEVHARLLFSLPLMVVAEVVVYVRMRAIGAQFIERQIVTEEVRPAFSRVVASAMRLRNSMAVEIGLLLVAGLGGPWLWRRANALGSDTWFMTVTSPSLDYTAAGNWYAFVSVPLFQFILLRWYFRIFIWCRLLFQISRLDLNLVPTHPDRCCGLSFLGNITIAFAPLLSAHSGLMAGYIANRIVHESATLPSYKIELIALVIFLIAIVVAPLCVFTPKLNRARIAGLRTYGRLASEYVAGFARKWGAGATMQREPLLGSADIQSLADLDNSFAIVREMKLAPFGKQTLIGFIVMIALPLAPLVLTMLSPEELIRRLITVML